MARLVGPVPLETAGDPGAGDRGDRNCIGGGKTAAVAASRPAVHTGHGCSLVGQKVAVLGTGFAALRTFDVSIDGIDFGQSTTIASGSGNPHTLRAPFEV
jgi:hypothetical protein